MAGGASQGALARPEPVDVNIVVDDDVEEVVALGRGRSHCHLLALAQHVRHGHVLLGEEQGRRGERSLSEGEWKSGRSLNLLFDTCQACRERRAQLFLTRRLERSTWQNKDIIDLCVCEYF